MKAYTMDKRGAEMAISTVVWIVLGLVVLIIIILVVREQITKGAAKYTEIGEQVTTTGGCSSFLEGRSCVEKGCPPDMTRVRGTWADCVEKGKKTKPASSYVCCKKKET